MLSFSIHNKDPSGNIMKKLNGVNTAKGVYAGEFQLSDVPKFGNWKITASVGDVVGSKVDSTFFTEWISTELGCRFTS